MMKLYTVTTIVPEYHRCRDVPFSWFKAEPLRGERPYRDLIADYDQADGDSRSYAEQAIDELFTEEEAARLVAYLAAMVDERGNTTTTTTTEESLPIANYVMATGAVPVGGGTDFYILYKDPNYPLPFKVMGYFDLRGCKLIDDSGVFV